MKPKATILIIGGAEDRGNKEMKEHRVDNGQYERFEILKDLLPKKGRKHIIEIIMTASSVPEEMQKMYLKAFKEIGFSDIGFIDIKDKAEAREADFCMRMEKAHAVFFSGGDQFKLASILGGTQSMQVIRDKYLHDKDFIVAGTSAGAMAIPNLMICQGGEHEAMLKDDIQIASGLGILDSCIVDTHFIKRGRFGRLAHAVVMNPEVLGIGLGEDTALIIKNGSDAECRGSGMVVIIDGNQILSTNITEIGNDDPIFVENLKVDILAKGSKFSIKDRKMAVKKLKM
ncbi:MAG TPA: cyanophycinase [Hanamia sp.]|nr:cyanophycinase [Hanamia sp.]